MYLPTQTVKSSSDAIRLGYDIQTGTAILAQICQTGHICVVGGTGSGKSMFILYILNSLLSLQAPIQLWIGDFKKSGDYAGITVPSRFAEFYEVTTLIERFYEEFEATPENYKGLKVLLLDEYAGFIIWLTQNDKKKCEEIKGKISNLLMLGRSRHCFVWCIQQRITAQLFPSGIGAMDNFQICIGLGNLSVQSRESLFAGEHFRDKAFEELYQPGQGQGLCLVDGQTLRALQVPHISDKGKLKALLRRKAHDRT